MGRAAAAATCHACIRLVNHADLNSLPDVSLEGVTYRALDLPTDHDDQARRGRADDVTAI